MTIDLKELQRRNHDEIETIATLECVGERPGTVFEEKLLASGKTEAARAG